MFVNNGIVSKQFIASKLSVLASGALSMHSSGVIFSHSLAVYQNKWQDGFCSFPIADCSFKKRLVR
jgi:hypothetical protein